MRKMMLDKNESTAMTWRVVHSIGLVGVLSAILLLEWLSPLARVLTWLCVLLLVAVIGLIIGHGVRGRWFGLLIDSNNRMSLSRLQILLWTLLILSGFLTAVAINTKVGVPEPLTIAIPPDLWLLMGISATSMVGVPIIQRAKQSRINSHQLNTTAIEARGNIAETSVSHRISGQQIERPQADAPSIADIFQDTHANQEKTVSIGHLQMFFFTVILLFGYGAAIASLFSTGEPIRAFPEIDGGMVALLGISHLSFLANKAVQ